MRSIVDYIRSTRSRPVLVLPIILVLIGGVYAGEQIFLRTAAGGWTPSGRGGEEEVVSAFHQYFAGFQDQLLHSAQRIASDPRLKTQLAARHDSSLVPFFELLQAYAQPELSLELYDPSLRLLGWTGKSSQSPDSSAFTNRDVSRIIEEPLYSYFVIVSPVIDSGGVAGYVVVKTLFDVNYPLNNRFINNRALASTFEKRLSSLGSFTLTVGDSSLAPPQDGIVAIPIVGIDSTIIGMAYTETPSLTSRLNSIRSAADSIIRFLLLGAAAMGAWLLIGYAIRKTGPTFQVILVTAGIWFVRYVLIWTSFPYSYVHLPLFDPGYFSSPLGAGLARSPGDLLLSCIALALNIIFIGRVVADQAQDDEPGTGLRWLEIVFCPIFVILFFGFLRGFLAAVRSAVIDSTLQYNDPMFILPPFILGVMLVSLLMLAGALVRGSILVITYLYRTVGTIPSLQKTGLRWIAVLVLLSVGASVFGMFAAEPLSTVSDRLFFGLAMTLGTLAAFGWNINILRPFSLRLIVVVLPLAGYLVISQLDYNVHRADRAAVENVARQMVKPVNVWLTSVVDSALTDLSSVDLSTLSEGPANEQRKLAFRQWAGSILSREGYNCWLGYVNAKGELVSDFHLGLVRHSTAERHADLSGAERSVRMEERNINGELIRIYRGYAPLRDSLGTVAGGVILELSADRQALLGGETPEILRNYVSGDNRELFRNVAYSEYFQGKLLSTTSEYLPKDRQAPAEAQRLMPGMGVWVDESVDGRDYETFYILRTENGHKRVEGSIVALSIERLDLRWHLFTIIRLIFFYFLVIGVAAGLVISFDALRGRPVYFGFRAKLLAAFLLVSLIPVAVLAYYNRQYAIEREDVVVARRLHDQTDALVSTLQKQRGVNAPFDIYRLTDEYCGDLANDLGIDFNVYADAYMQASSKPELFMAELFDPRLSAHAYTEVVLHRTGFFTEQQSIGGYAYVVGYRPVVSEAGSVIGVVSVPTLYGQHEINEELMARNAFLFSAYALAVIVAIGAGFFFTRQISSPVVRLQEAARQIGRGNLDFRLERTRQDELGELEDAFNHMAAELRQAQEQAFRAQREQAWKEMARQVAHEIKNPLTPMKLSIQHLQHAYADRADKFEKTLDDVSRTILEQINTLSRIASEFSRFGRMPERVTEVCAIDEVLGEAIRLFEGAGRIQILEQLEATSACVHADREELRRAFINILQNAVQAIPGEGSVTVRSAAVDGRITVAFADTGKGIPEEYRGRLFEPNFSTKTEGTGLGLALVKKTIDDLGGSVSIASEVGKGTEVTITLPAAR